MSPRVEPSEFFNDERSWQWIKHTVFSDYIWPWATIVGKYSNQIFIVDAFAGAGKFNNAKTGAEVEGSPLIAATKAIGYNATHAADGRRCDIICIEKDPANFNSLSEALLPRFASCATILQGSYADHVHLLLDRVGHSPVLLLIDPMGPKSVPLDEIRPLLEKSGKNDVFMTLHFGVVHRVLGMLRDDGQVKDMVHGAAKQAENLDRFFGSSDWRQLGLQARSDGEHRHVESVLVAHYLERCAPDRFAYRSAYPVRKSLHAPPKYWLAHLADDEKPFWLCNDAIVKVDRILLDQTYADPNALPGFSESLSISRDAQVMENLQTAMLRELDIQGGSATFSHLRTELAEEFFGRVKKTRYSAAIKDLLSNGRVLREKSGLRPKIDDSELIRVATS